MDIILIAAMERGRGIGCGGRLPWHYPEDLKRFKAATMGHPILMGRKTCESLPSGPLPGRDNLVLTRRGLKGPSGSSGYRQFSTPGDLLTTGEREEWQELYVIGGEEIFRLFLQEADRLLITRIDAAYRCDRFFPPISPDDWVLRSSETEGVLTFEDYRRSIRAR